MTKTENIPAYLREHGFFNVWRYEKDQKGRITKIPYNPNNPQHKGDPTNRSTFANLSTAEARADGFDGLGIGIFDSVAAIDIDHCMKDGKLTAMAADIVETMDAYTETSPSGEGLRILFLAPGFQYDRDKYYINNQSKGLEIYLPGMTNKYVTVTGNTLRSRDMMDRTDRLQPILDKYMTRSSQSSQPVTTVPVTPIDISDDDLIERAMSATNGAKFADLWNGGLYGYPSQSEADQALCNLLAFWTGKDASRMEVLFRQSGLNREGGGKYKNKSHYDRYLKKTIDKAIASCSEVYTPPQEHIKPSRTYPRPNNSGDDKNIQDTPETPKNEAQDVTEGNQNVILTKERALHILNTFDDNFLLMPHFPQLSEIMRIRTHDSIAIAADTGAGKSSLALNILHELQSELPAVYINLEMDEATILQRLVAIHTGMKLDMIEGYKNDENTRAKVEAAVVEILSRKEIRLLTDVYSLEDIETQIKAATKGRTDPTLVFVDTGLLVTTSNRSASRYERFTHISEELRRMARINNVIMFVLLQQNRDGKRSSKSDPKNSSLKETGSWENDATKVLFLSNEPNRRKKLTITKNRNGKLGEIVLNYKPDTQTYSESKYRYPSHYDTPTADECEDSETSDEDNPFI